MPCPTLLCPFSDDSCSAEAGGLEPGKAYYFRLQAMNSQGAGQWSSWTLVTTAAEAPSQPAPPLVTASSSSSVSLKWMPPACLGAPVTHFLVESAQLGYQHSSGAFDPELVLLDAHGGPVFKCIYKGPVCEVDTRGLKPSTRYAFRVAAVNAVGSSPFSQANEVLTGPAPPCAPTRVSVHPCSSSELELMWEEPAMDNGAAVTCYCADMLVQSGGRSARGASSSASWQQCYTGSVATGRVAGLQPGRSHSFRVRAANCCGFGPYSASTTASTLPSPPSAPTKLSLSQRTCNSVRAKWEVPDEDNGAPVQAFQVELSTSGIDGWHSAYFGKDIQHKLVGLQPGSKYWLRVAALNSAGYGAYSSVEAFATLLAPPGPPRDVSVQDVSSLADSAAVLVSWQSPEPVPNSAAAMSFELTALPAGDPSLSMIKQVVGPALTECRLERLSPGIQYTFRMRTVGADATGHSCWSADVCMVTAGGQKRPDLDSLSVSSESSAMSLQVRRPLLLLGPPSLFQTVCYVCIYTFVLH